MAWPAFAFRSSTLSKLPLGPNCTGESPSDRAKTIPFAIITGVGTDMFSEFQAGVNTGLPASKSTLNAITLPSGVSPCCKANLVAGAGGPQAGAYSQRVPAASSQVEKAPQNPFPAKFTSWLANSGLRYKGTRWSGPPSDLVSSRKITPSLPLAAASSQFLKLKMVEPILPISRSFLVIHDRLRGVQ